MPPKKGSSAGQKSSNAQYVVEEIVNKRTRNNKVEYKIKWKNFPMEENTWEPLSHLKCPLLVAEYERKHAPKASSTKSSDNKQYLVEKIIGKRIKNNKVEYRIKWKKCPESENSWEPVSNLKCQKLIKEYENKTAPTQPSPGDESDDSSDGESTDGINYSVEKILDKKTGKNGVKYLIQWKKCDPSQNSWEPLSHLTCDKLIEEFEKKHAAPPPRAPAPKRPRAASPQPSTSPQPSAAPTPAPSVNPAATQQIPKAPAPKLPRPASPQPSAVSAPVPSVNPAVTQQTPNAPAPNIPPRPASPQPSTSPQPSAAAAPVPSGNPAAVTKINAATQQTPKAPAPEPPRPASPQPSAASVPVPSGNTAATQQTPKAPAPKFPPRPASPQPSTSAASAPFPLISPVPFGNPGLLKEIKSLRKRGENFFLECKMGDGSEKTFACAQAADAWPKQVIEFYQGLLFPQLNDSMTGLP